MMFIFFMLLFQIIVSPLFASNVSWDPFHWLEDAQSDAVKTWVQAQNQNTRQALDGVTVRPALQARLKELTYSPPATPAQINGKYYSVSGGNLCVSDTWDGNGVRVLVDPKKFIPSGFGAINEYAISPDANVLFFGYWDR